MARRRQTELTTEQEAYCRARALGMSIKEALAASRCSVTESTARKWELPTSSANNPLVISRIAELTTIAQSNAILKTGLTREWVISRLMSVVERCMQAEQVEIGGKPVEGLYAFDAKGANTALKLLGDTLGIFKHEPQKTENELEALSDDDLHRLAAELAQDVGLLTSDAGD